MRSGLLAANEKEDRERATSCCRWWYGTTETGVGIYERACRHRQPRLALTVARPGWDGLLMCRSAEISDTDFRVPSRDGHVGQLGSPPLIQPCPSARISPMFPFYSSARIFVGFGKAFRKAYETLDKILPFLCHLCAARVRYARRIFHGHICVEIECRALMRSPNPRPRVHDLQRAALHPPEQELFPSHGNVLMETASCQAQLPTHHCTTEYFTMLGDPLINETLLNIYYLVICLWRVLIPRVNVEARGICGRGNKLNSS